MRDTRSLGDGGSATTKPTASSNALLRPIVALLAGLGQEFFIIYLKFGERALPCADTRVRRACGPKKKNARHAGRLSIVASGTEAVPAFDQRMSEA